ncbi:MAG: hypothetical protein EBX50_17565, partial [Chitinophagia bacterium]|nr:hypothetical protein [Chitinophagia bacterium]
SEKAVNERELKQLKEVADKALEKASDETKASIDTQQATIQNLRDDLNRAKASFEAMAEEKERLQAQMKTLEESHIEALKHIQTEKDAAESKINELTSSSAKISSDSSAEARKLHDEIKTLTDANEAVKTESDNKIAVLQEKVLELEKNIEDANTAFDNAKKELSEQLKKVNAQLADSGKELNDAQSRSTTEVGELKEAKDKLESQIKDLEKQLAKAATDSGADKAALEQKLVDANAELTANAASLHDLQATNAASILECTTKLASLNRELDLLKERDASIIKKYNELREPAPTDPVKLQEYIKTLTQAIGVLTDDTSKTRAQRMLDFASSKMTDQIAAFRANIARLEGINPITGTTSIYSIDEILEIMAKYVLALKNNSSSEHPFKDVIDHFTLQHGGTGDGKDDKIVLEHNIDTVKSSLDEFMRTPFKWRDEISSKYMYEGVIKLLSMPYDTFSHIDVFKTDQVKQALALTVFWDATPLLSLLETDVGINKLFNAEFIALKIKSTGYADKLKPYDFNSNIRFLMTEDMIDFYTKISNQYFRRGRTLNPKTFSLFVRAYQDYVLWVEFEKAVYTKFLDIIQSKKTDIDEKYKDAQDQVVTYLKVRCDDHITKRYNRYFNVYTENDLPSQGNVFIAGPGPNIKIKFNKYNGEDIDTTQDGKYKLVRFNGNVSKVKHYAYSYLYGPFTRTFGPDMNNLQVSQKCTEITDALRNGQNVFVIGYGASGAGKTSSLIYFDKGKDSNGRDDPALSDGILINICRNCRATNIDLSVYELYGKTGGETGIIEYKNIPFVLEENQYVIK